jgi:hypothetical protein
MSKYEILGELTGKTFATTTKAGFPAVKPADAALLRDIANAAMDDAADRGDGIRAVAVSDHAAARLDALADVLDFIRNRKMLTATVFPGGGISATSEDRFGADAELGAALTALFRA